MRDNGGWKQGESHIGGDKRSDTGCLLKLESTGFADGLDGGVREREGHQK